MDALTVTSLQAASQWRGKYQLSNTTFIASVDVFPCTQQKLGPDKNIDCDLFP